MHERGRNDKSRPGRYPVFLVVFNHSLESQSKLAKILLRNKSAMFVICGNEYGVINSLLEQCRAACSLSRPQTGDGLLTQIRRVRRERFLPDKPRQ